MWEVALDETKKENGRCFGHALKKNNTPQRSDCLYHGIKIWIERSLLQYNITVFGQHNLCDIVTK